MNSKLNVLKGEEIRRPFNYRVVVTNPNALSEIEENKRKELFQRLQQIVENTSISEDEAKAKVQELGKYMTYKW